MDNTKLKNKILGYGFMLEKTMISEFKRIYPEVIIKQLEEQTERPTIDVNDYAKKPGKALNTNSIGASYFKAEPGFRPRIKVPPSKNIVSFIDTDGKLRYKYED